MQKCNYFTRFGLVLFFLTLLGSSAGAQQPTMAQLVGINVKPQEKLSGMTKFSTIRSWHLFADDISLGGGGWQWLPF
jgi:hypothetical protein